MSDSLDNHYNYYLFAHNVNTGRYDMLTTGNNYLLVFAYGNGLSERYDSFHIRTRRELEYPSDIFVHHMPYWRDEKVIRLNSNWQKEGF